MSLTRKCGSCGKMIAQEKCLELTARVFVTDGGENQDGAQVYDDYCDPCIADGSALKDLLSGLENYPEKKEETA